MNRSTYTGISILYEIHKGMVKDNFSATTGINKNNVISVISVEG